jgi:stage V sporulation protein S
MDPTNPTITRDGNTDATLTDVITETAPIYDDTEILKVSAHSRPSAVAGAIAAVIRNHGRADVQAIGAGATNQAIKAVAIARDYLRPDSIDIVVIPAFIDVVIADEERTAIRLVVESRSS